MGVSNFDTIIDFNMFILILTLMKLCRSSIKLFMIIVYDIGVCGDRTDCSGSQCFMVQRKQGALISLALNESS